MHMVARQSVYPKKQAIPYIYNKFFISHIITFKYLKKNFLPVLPFNIKVEMDIEKDMKH